VGESPLIRKHVAVLSEALGTIGGPQVRNMATIGGNLCRCAGYDSIINAVENSMNEDT
jgi:CO/xanthine dehydrogenase FAD-binding subunit